MIQGKDMLFSYVISVIENRDFMQSIIVKKCSVLRGFCLKK